MTTVWEGRASTNQGRSHRHTCDQVSRPCPNCCCILLIIFLLKPRSHDGLYDKNLSLVDTCKRHGNSVLLHISLLLLLLLLLLTAIELSLGGSSPYTSTDKTNKNKYTQTKQYKNTVQTIQNIVNTSTHITRTPTYYKTHTYTHQHYVYHLPVSERLSVNVTQIQGFANVSFLIKSLRRHVDT